MNELCERVRLAEMALLDGETPAMAIEAARAHQAECTACREAVAAVREVHAALEEAAFARPDANLWARVGPAISAGQASSRRSMWLGVAAAAALVVWRVAQVAVEWPAALAMSSAAIAVVAATWWMVTSDALAIRPSISELRQEGVR